jgi:hypothetical protein
MAALAGGLVALVLGIVGIIAWWDEFVVLLMGAIPIMLIFGGALAAYLGFEEIKDKQTSESFDAGKEDLQQEVETLRRELKELKGEQGDEKEEKDK